MVDEEEGRSKAGSKSEYRKVGDVEVKEAFDMFSKVNTMEPCCFA